MTQQGQKAFNARDRELTMKWNPAEEREAFLQDDGFLIQSYLDEEFDPDAPMGNCAIVNVRTVINCWLCGLAKEIQPIFVSTFDWLEFAIAKGEATGPSRYHRANLYVAKAICEWLDKSTNDLGAWKDAMAHAILRFQKDGSNRREAVSEYLDQVMPSCYFAGDYETGIAEFEKCCDVRSLSLNKTWRPREFAYAMCLHRLRGEFSVDELVEAGEKMLRSYLDEEFLCNGEYIDAAIWLKMVYGLKTPELTPMQTLLSAYDVMNEELPKFVAEAIQ